jgi:WXG100 family type VII secretion target
MSEDIKVSFPAIQQLSTDVQNESNKIQSSLDTLDGEVKKLYGSWDGQAQQSYQNSKAKWDQQMADIHAILQELQGKVDAAGVQYQNTESRNASRFEA